MGLLLGEEEKGPVALCLTGWDYCECSLFFLFLSVCTRVPGVVGKSVEPPSLAPGLLGHSEHGFFPSPNFEETHQLCGLATVRTHTNWAYERAVRQTFAHTLVQYSAYLR